MLGTPLTSVRAPTLFSAYFEKIGADAVMVPLEVAGDYPVFLRRLFQAANVDGAMVTFPYKRVIDVLNGWSSAVEVARACNIIVKRPDGTLYGDISDGTGFLAGLQRAGFDCAGAKCLLVGSGGAGAAIAAALIDAGIAQLGIHGRESALALIERLRRYAAGAAVIIERVENDPRDYDLVINATPLGMRPDDPLPIDVTRLTPRTTVADIVMAQETALLRAAVAKGCRTQPGTKMLFEQVSHVSQFWGYPPVAWSEVQALVRSLGWAP
jgi:shikimate dehydrogenase